MENLILRDRERRSYLIKNLTEIFINQTIVCIKANVVGEDKNISEAKAIVEYFDGYTKSFFDECFYLKKTSYDGEYILKVIDESDAKKIKAITSNIEDEHIIGRYIDIDVYSNSFINLSRKKARKCLICDKIAFECNREKKHSVDILLKKFKTDINDFFLAQTLAKYAFKALVTEAFVYPKFGCVSAVNSGCHNDMDIYKFLISAMSLHKYFLKIAILAIKEDNSKMAFEKSREIGKMAENEMLVATNGVNTHKGAIFTLGILIIATVEVITNKSNFDNIQSEITKMCYGIVATELESLKKKKASSLTYGEKINLENNLSGIRGEAESGFNTIFNIGLKTFEKCMDMKLNDKLVETFICLIAYTEDTTVLHKSRDLNLLKEIQNDMHNLIALGGYKNTRGKKRIMEKNMEYIKRGISPGGSADLLSGVVFLSDVKGKTEV